MSSENKSCYTLTLKLETEQHQVDYLNRVFSHVFDNEISISLHLP